MRDGIFLSLGGNIGDTQSAFVDAIELLEQKGVTIIKESPIYRTEPVGNTDQDWFLNQVIQVQTSLSPQELLRDCLQTEEEVGRIHKDERWGPREIDLDILFYNQKVIDSKDLKIPHPEIINRRCILIPMVDVAQDFVHPSIGKTMKFLLDSLNLRDKSEVIQL